MKKTSIILLLPSLGLVFFGLNYFFEFIHFENPKINPLILMLLSLINLIVIIRKLNKDNNID